MPRGRESAMRAEDVFEDGAWHGVHRMLVQVAPSLVDPQDLFEAFVEARDGNGPGAVYFNHEIERHVFARQHGEPTPKERIPAASDRSFAGYADRLKRDLEKEQRYCLRMIEAHAHSRAIYTRIGAFVAPLERVLRADSRAVRTTVFVGDYEFTPFGVHVDPYPQIQFTITGTRSGLFWDSTYWNEKSEADRLEPWKHLERAMETPLREGDAVYWPADYEHAFWSRDGFGIGLTLSFPKVPEPDSEI